MKQLFPKANVEEIETNFYEAPKNINVDKSTICFHFVFTTARVDHLSLPGFTERLKELFRGFFINFSNRN